MEDGNVVVLCRLRELMNERGLRYCDLVSAGIGTKTVANLLQEEWHSVSRATMERLCGFLGIGIGELFEAVAQDLWLSGVHKRGEVTIHLGLRPSGLPDAGWGHGELRSGDVFACRTVTEFLHSLGAVRVSIEVHPHGIVEGAPQCLPAGVRQILRSGFHIVVGSPIANPWTEPVVSAMYGVSPYAPGEQARLPYAMVWKNHVRSSFGYQGAWGETGIFSRRARRLIAHRTCQDDGTVLDCAIIVARRYLMPRRERRWPGETRAVIVVFGHGAAGTYAGAIAATRPDVARAMFAPGLDTVVAGVVGVRYRRPETGAPDVGLELEPELLEVAHTVVGGPAAPRTWGG